MSYIKVQDSGEIWGKVKDYPEASDLLAAVVKDELWGTYPRAVAPPMKITRIRIRNCVGNCDWMDLDELKSHWHEAEDGQRGGATPAWKLWE